MSTEGYFDREAGVSPTADEGRWETHLGTDWNIGQNPNGGYLASIVLAAMAQAVPHPFPLAVNAHFQRPGVPNAFGEVETDVVRVGRTTSTVSGRLLQEGKERLRLLATFGDKTEPDAALQSVLEERRDDVAALALRPVELPPPDQCRSRGELAQGIDLPIMSRLDVRIPDKWAEAGESGEAVVGGWIRFVDDRPPDVRSLIVFCDAFPPSPFGLLGRLGWVPTLELTLHVRRPPSPGWIRARFETHELVDGLLVEDGVLWDSDGEVVAQCRQLALLKVEQ